ncbi:nosA C6 finger domain transcription factor nosA [Candida maltosa Xu316]|uniref:Zn(2)-C6 fungal-type domain-containing protein n=1 Tax=Candida maltosa (strain Xu316) TaxID=1245528 RepID=M3J3S1_CANMX|nr:hypothetical protein G210_3215 [Candida maltosa Xu316]
METILQFTEGQQGNGQETEEEGKPPLKKRKHNRVRTGCFTCRKRKKKCDEKQPHCVGCIRNKLKCIYPTKWNERLPSNFVLEEQEYHEPLDYKKKKPLKRLKVDNAPDDLFGVIVLNKYSQQQQQQQPESVTPISSVFSDSEESNDALDENDMPLVVQTPAETPTFASIWADTSLIGFGKYLPNIQLSLEDAELYSHCVKNFMEMISMPHSHPLLSPTKLWIELASRSPILTDVYLSCGATYLACANDGNQEIARKYQQMAEEKYDSAVKSLMDAIANNNIDLDSNWLMTAGLILCLRDRSHGLNGSRCAKHVAFVYNLIQRRMAKLSVEDERLATPEERLLMESFVFNYSSSLMTCSKQDVLTLPAPSELFAKVGRWLQQPIYENCDVAWMNNPVLGSALSSFEVMSKLIDLLRRHFEFGPEEDKYIGDSEFWQTIFTLQNDITEVDKFNAENNASLALLMTNQSLYFALRSNLAVSIVTINACKILMEKMMNPSLPAFVPKIQKLVADSMHELNAYMPSDNYSSSVALLGIFICGTAIMNKQDQISLCDNLTSIENCASRYVALNTVGVLTKSWEREKLDETEFGDKGYKCFDLLFDRTTLESIHF